jgi:hypothetical protein
LLWTISPRIRHRIAVPGGVPIVAFRPGTMLTADEAYYRKASGYGGVVLLREFEPS